MILDQLSNWENYLGLTDTLDMALRFLGSIPLYAFEVDRHGALDGKRLFYAVSESPLREAYHQFEYHRAYIDIHVPLTMMECIAVCSAADRPAAIAFSAEKDCGLFSAPAVNQLSVPVGWFCICFPGDAHAPCLAGRPEDVGKVLRKLIVKAEASGAS